jgi:hypothetical protein
MSKLTSFKKFLIANRGENSRAATVSAKPDRTLLEAQVCDFGPMEAAHV